MEQSIHKLSQAVTTLSGEIVIWITCMDDRRFSPNMILNDGCIIPYKFTTEDFAVTCENCLDIIEGSDI